MELIPQGPCVDELEIRSFTSHRPSGDVPGYQIRFRLIEDQPTEWLFLTEAQLEAMPKTILLHMRSEGHLRGDIGGLVH